MPLRKEGICGRQMNDSAPQSSASQNRLNVKSGSLRLNHRGSAPFWIRFIQRAQGTYAKPNYSFGLTTECSRQSKFIAGDQGAAMTKSPSERALRMIPPYCISIMPTRGG